MIYNTYSATINGGLVQTGNTFGLAGHSMGHGVLNLTVADVSPPGGNITTDYMQASSSAYLTIPSGGSVVFAQLVWMGTYYNTARIELPNYNDDLTLEGPSGIKYTISPNPTYSQQVTSNQSKLYSNAQDITTIVKAEKAGRYTVAALPTLTGANDAATGWQIIVAYASSNEPMRNLNVWCCFESIVGIGVGTPPVQIPVTNFITPTSSAVNARLIVSAGGGNPDLTNDYVQFGTDPEDEATMTVLYGPNNAANNFFASQINGNDGLLDTSGTWGNANTLPPFWASVGKRNSWDITNIDISYAMTNGQTSGYITLNTRADTYQVTAVGLQIDMNQATFIPFEKSADKTTTRRGNIVTYSIRFQNVGDVEAESVLFVDDLPSGVNFVPDSVKIDGVSIPGANPVTGINIGNVQPNQSVSSVLNFQVVVTESAPSVISNTARLMYSFVPGEGLEPIEAEQTSNQVDIPMEVDIPPLKTASQYFFRTSKTSDIDFQITYYTENILNDSSKIVIEDKIDSVLQLNYYYLDLEPSADIVIVDETVGNNIKYTITTTGEGTFPDSFNLYVKTTYISGTIDTECYTILNDSTMQINSDEALISNTVYIKSITKREQAKIDLIESIALEQTALSHIINAEGEKIQKILEINASYQEIIAINDSVKETINSVSNLESILLSKLKDVKEESSC